MNSDVHDILIPVMWQCFVRAVRDCEEQPRLVMRALHEQQLRLQSLHATVPVSVYT